MQTPITHPDDHQPRDDRDPPEDWAALDLQIGAHAVTSTWCRGDKSLPTVRPFFGVSVALHTGRGRYRHWSAIGAPGREAAAVAAALSALDLLDEDGASPIDVTVDGVRILVARVDGDVRIEIRRAA